MKNDSGRSATPNNRKKIIDAAITLFGEKGVEKTSLADIARTVGISKGTLYYYYSTKNDLIFDITKVHMEEITGGIFSIIDQKKETVSWQWLLKHLIETLLESETRTKLHLYLIQEALLGNLELKERFQKTYTQWFDMVQDAFFKTTSIEKDLSVHARLLVSFIDGLIIQSSIGLEAMPLDQAISEISKTIFDE